MGTITRHAGAPFAAGETSAAADLEADLATAYNEFNGSIENANVSASADIDGDKIRTATITNTEIDSSNKIATSKMATRCYISIDGTGDTMTTSTSMVDVPSIQSVTVLPQTTTDILVIRFMAVVDLVSAQYLWGFEIDGVDTNALAVITSSGSTTHTLDYLWATATGTTAPITIRPRYAAVTTSGTFTTSVTPSGGSATTLEANKVLTVEVLPG